MFFFSKNWQKFSFSLQETQRYKTISIKQKKNQK